MKMAIGKLDAGSQCVGGLLKPKPINEKLFCSDFGRNDDLINSF